MKNFVLTMIPSSIDICSHLVLYFVYRQYLCCLDAGVRVIPGEIDECVLEIQILWSTEKERVILMIELPGPDYEVKVWLFVLARFVVISVNSCL